MDKTKLSRLLHLYPVEVLREAWDLKGMTKAEIVDHIVEESPQGDIENFCRINHGRTKQRVILLNNLSGKLKGFGDPLLGTAAPIFLRRTSQTLEEFYLLSVSYTAVVGPPYTEQTVNFLWPVAVEVNSATVRLTFTIIEKNIGTYLAGATNAYGVRKDIDEEGVINLLVAALDDPANVERSDINKGVKQLWAEDKIDAIQTKWKGAKATLTETMDGKFLMKRDDRPAYERAIKAPLLKTVFHTLVADVKFPGLFSVVPSEGELAVTRYPDDAEEMANVVRAILSAN